MHAPPHTHTHPYIVMTCMSQGTGGGGGGGGGGERERESLFVIETDTTSKHNRRQTLIRAHLFKLHENILIDLVPFLVGDKICRYSFSK